MTDTSTAAVGRLISNLRQWRATSPDAWILCAADQLEHLLRERDVLVIKLKDAEKEAQHFFEEYEQEKGFGH